ncbi:MAG: fumarylacetoacetate hydrolase family protein [Burkholderiaceae bacterium]|nr:fumarylacetoacetate hydrolase family protein [Burkholderiaceae bacterium]
MKLATYHDGSRDGQLLVVSRDLGTAHYATGIAHKLQQVLDDWGFLAPQLQDLSVQLNQGRARHAFPFDPQRCMAPLPRAYQWAAGAAYPAGAASAGHPATEPGVFQGASDALLGPCDDVVLPSEALGIDFGASIAVVTGDVPRGVSPEQALGAIRLVMLANEISLRQRMPHERAQGTGFVQSKPATAFSPVAVTLEELGEAWDQGRVHLPLQTLWNGRKVGLCEAGQGMAFHFGQLIAHLARTRPLGAGTVVGSGPVSNPGVQDAQGRTDWPRGYHCIADKRAMETLHNGQPHTGFLQFGDTVRIEMKGKNGQSLFGAIDQAIAAPQGL